MANLYPRIVPSTYFNCRFPVLGFARATFRRYAPMHTTFFVFFTLPPYRMGPRRPKRPTGCHFERKSQQNRAFRLTSTPKSYAQPKIPAHESPLKGPRVPSGSFRVPYPSFWDASRCSLRALCAVAGWSLVLRSQLALCAASHVAHPRHSDHTALLLACGLRRSIAASDNSTYVNCWY